MAADPKDDFEALRCRTVAGMADDKQLQQITREWFAKASKHYYSYHFNWLGRPIIQFPQDLIALQEIVWDTKPDLIVETGVARGGSLVFYASLLELVGGDGLVVGIDVDFRPHNRAALASHPLSRRIEVLDGSSTDTAIVEAVRRRAATRPRVLVVLDSLHTHDHVLGELRAYAPLVRPPSYLVVLDTIIEDMAADFSADRPWGPGDNPKTAIAAFLAETDRFEVDRELEAKLLISVAPGGYLRCVKDHQS